MKRNYINISKVQMLLDKYIQDVKIKKLIMSQFNKAYKEGFEDGTWKGYKDGYEDGKVDGFIDGTEDAEERVREVLDL